MRLFIYGSAVIGSHDDISTARILKDPETVRELTEKEITEIFGKYAHLACPLNTFVDADGTITFNFDKQAYLTEQAQVVRAERDLRLKASDWRVLPDVPKSEPWMTYRQALRDIPNQEGFPEAVEWPKEPT